MGGRNVYVFDLDGTLADVAHRAHLAPPRNPDSTWEAYHAACPDDAPIEGAWRLVEAFRQIPGAELYVCTGRADHAYHQTREWLDRYTYRYLTERVYRTFAGIWMRPSGDHRRNPDLKVEYASRIGWERIALWIDDYPAVCERLADLGIPTLLVNSNQQEGV